mmetsp:Transcript_7071/g.20800  ORF Transcript_7071/g.20800 Transcript_7071/m.20800 type:complete len:250 (+) Transcript_7071:119-868(+)
MAELSEAKPAGKAEPPLVGVLALQGSVEEHVAMLKKRGANVREIRTPQEVPGVEGLVFPGGESTAIGIMSSGDGLFEALRREVDAGVPVYGTCAGMILLANDAVGKRKGGQAAVGGLNCTVCRNYFGAQVSSFELPLAASGATAEAARLASDYPAVFIRAPAILELGEGCEALASVTAAPCAAAAPEVAAFDARGEPAAKKAKKEGAAEREVVVAARQGNILVTAFHPELTEDPRWHDLFLGMVKGRKA